MFAETPLEIAIKDATDFLESQCGKDGLWRDFHTLAGASSDWVTGFVTYAIAQSQRSPDYILMALKTLLSRQRPNGGWSYNKTVPTDCDSTAWVLLALATTTTWRPSAVQRARQYINRHWEASLGGFSTYSASDRIDRFIGAPDQTLTQGWLMSHPCVTSVAIQSLLMNGESIQTQQIQSSTKYLLQARDHVGVWYSYWWKGYGYNTYHALKALLMTRRLKLIECQQTTQFLCSQQRDDGGWNDSNGEKSEVFATAFILLSILLFPDQSSLKSVTQGIDWLLCQQNANGSWKSDPILRIPPPMMKQPDSSETWQINQEGTGVIIEDSSGIFTTAAALWVISVFRAITNGMP